MIGSVQVSLVAHRPGGPPLQGELIRRLAHREQVEDCLPGDAPGRSERVVFRTVRLQEFRDGSEPSEDMAAATRDALLSLAVFLGEQDAGLLGQLGDSGIRVRVFVSLYMNRDQFELTLPAPLLRSAGRLGWDVELISNDISVEQALAWGAT